jgi:hypothetical protein
MREQRADVELDAGHHEEHRDQEPKPDRAQLGLVTLLIGPRVAVRHGHHHAGDERAEQ